MLQGSFASSSLLNTSFSCTAAVATCLTDKTGMELITVPRHVELSISTTAYHWAAASVQCPRRSSHACAVQPAEYVNCSRATTVLTRDVQRLTYHQPLCHVYAGIGRLVATGKPLGCLWSPRGNPQGLASTCLARFDRHNSRAAEAFRCWREI